MCLRLLSLALVGLAGLGCAPDRSITHGADGAPEWSRRLQSAVAVGMPLDSARATMERNGFHCEFPSGDARSLYCEKRSGARVALVRRRWQATLAIENGHVRGVQGTTGLIGP